MPTDTTATAPYRERLRRAQAELERRQIDLLLVGPSPDLRYLTGYDAHTSERLSLLVLPRTGKPSYVVPALEAPLLANLRDLLDIQVWSEKDAPAAVVAEVAGTGGGRSVAVSDQLWSVFLLRLQETMPGNSWCSGSETMAALRMCKDEREVGLLREAAHRTDEAWEEFVRQPLSGQTETEAMRRLQALTESRGLRAAFGICASGPNSASPHHHTGDRVIEQGDAVVFDWGGTLDGYHSDVTRTVHVGAPDDEFRRVYTIVLAANQAALDAVRPSVACEEIDRAARSLIAAEGYGEAFLHRVGHGLGLDVHEEPYLVSGNRLPLATGMVVSDEPGIYLEGRFGVRIEDAVVCLDQGGERLNEANRELTIVD